MPSNNFKIFDENKLNMMNDTEYSTYQQRLNGVQTGVANSKLQNKTLYQLTLVASAIASIVNKNGFNFLDTSTSDELSSYLSATLVQKVDDMANESDLRNPPSTMKWVSPSLLVNYVDVVSPKIVSRFVSASRTNFVSSSTYPQYKYQCDVTANGVSSSFSPIVVFEPEQLNWNILAPVSICGTNFVRIYSSDLPPSSVSSFDFNVICVTPGGSW